MSPHPSASPCPAVSPRVPVSPLTREAGQVHGAQVGGADDGDREAPGRGQVAQREVHLPQVCLLLPGAKVSRGHRSVESKVMGSKISGVKGHRVWGRVKGQRARGRLGVAPGLGTGSKGIRGHSGVRGRWGQGSQGGQRSQIGDASGWGSAPAPGLELHTHLQMRLPMHVRTCTHVCNPGCKRSQRCKRIGQD